jgi:uncharacterized membrane protein
MNEKLAKIPVGRIIIAAICVEIFSIVLITLVVFVYAFSLAFKAMGAPDQELISQFAAKIGDKLTPFFEVLFTFLGGLWVMKKSYAGKIPSGLILGFLVVIISIIFQFVFKDPFRLMDVVWYILFIVTGWLSGFIKKLPINKSCCS